MKNEQKWIAVVAALCLSPPALWADLPAYRLVELKPPGTMYSYVWDVNNQGQAVGYSYPFAVIWNQGQAQQLDQGQGQAINSNGTVVAGGYGVHAFMWDAASGSTTFPTPDGEYGWMQFGDINDMGQVVGTHLGYSTELRRAFLFDGQSYTFLLPPGAPQSEGAAINAMGHIAGRSRYPGSYSAWRYGSFLYRDGQFIELVPPAGWEEVLVYDINDHDVLAGQLLNLPQDMSRAFTYDLPNDRWTVLPITPDRTHAAAYGINNLGQVVGHMLYSSGAALWDADGTLYLLNELIPPELGWDLYYANAINDSGVICGGEIPSNWDTRACLLVPGRCDGDILPDSKIDIADLAAFLSAYASCDGDPNFEPAADINADGCIDLDDLGELLANYGNSCW